VLLPSLPAAPGSPAGPDLRLRVAEVQPAPEPVECWLLQRTLPGELAPYLQVARTGGGYRLRHPLGVDLIVAEGGSDLTLQPWREVDRLELEHVLVNLLLPLVVAHLGRLSFHGSAVRWEDRAVAFLGPSGAGKSTLAAAAVTLGGAELLADDHVALEERGSELIAHPSYAGVRMLPDAARALFGRDQQAGAKEHIPIAGARAGVPLRAIHLLAPEADGNDARIERLGWRDALVGVAAHLDRLDPFDRPALTREMDGLERLVRLARVSRLVIGHRGGLLRMREAVDVVRRDLEDVTGP
jgi:hypothetical protein